jgi:methionyl-tRNA formyltransferase
MKIVLWIGNESNQIALANKIHKAFPITGIVMEAKKGQRSLSIYSLFEKVVEKSLLRAIGKAWRGMLAFYKKGFPKLPDVPVLKIENINDSEAYEFTKRFSPDLIMVSGTRLIRKNLLSIKVSIGILNLHTGLSPYIKGGPNCTNWCIAKKQSHLIGNTVMWIDENVDTGNLMATEFTEFSGKESLLDIHIKVMEHAHDLYLKSLVSISKGKINNIPQKDIAKGVTYRNKQWGLNEKFLLLRNLRSFRKVFQLRQAEKLRSAISTVSLDI